MFPYPFHYIFLVHHTCTYASHPSHPVLGRRGALGWSTTPWRWWDPPIWSISALSSEYFLNANLAEVFHVVKTRDFTPSYAMYIMTLNLLRQETQSSPFSGRKRAKTLACLHPLQDATILATRIKLRSIFLITKGSPPHDRHSSYLRNRE